jgi:hypothetical protein
MMVEAIVDVLAGYEKLWKLHLSVLFLDPKLFDLFLTKLPDLGFLYLRFLQIYNTELPPANTAEVYEVSLYNLFKLFAYWLGESFVRQCGDVHIQVVTTNCAI